MTKWWMILGYFLLVGGVLNIPSNLWTHIYIPIGVGLSILFVSSLPLLRLLISLTYTLMIKKA